MLLQNWNRVLIVLSSIILIFLASFTDFDKRGELLINESMQEAAVVFGVVKGLNAVISLAQGTEVGFVGLTISIGEILDPINDLVERFSLVMLASIVSLGIQKILMNVVVSNGFNVLLLLSIILVNIWLFVRFKNDAKVRGLFYKTTVVLIFLRFSISLLSYASYSIYVHYIQQDYNIEKSREEIVKSSEEIDNITKERIDNEKSEQNTLLEYPLKLFKSIKEKVSSEYYEKEINKYKEASEKAGEQIVSLMIAFIFKTIFFPLLFLFILYRVIWNIFIWRDI